ncbi:MAG: hypothetical protein M3Y41_13200 [Pseudomonadota bacterium]|nr:hypothetical protein [Pseudomonadota bacterium]
MPVTITLSTMPGKLTRKDRCTAKTVELFGKSLASETLDAVSSVPDIRAAVARFGAGVRAGHPGASFYVSVRLAKGSRKPNGYDAASNLNGFGQDDFLHVEDKRTKPLTGATALTPFEIVTG